MSPRTKTFYSIACQVKAGCSLEVFQERVKGAKYKWLFVNTNKELGDRNCSSCGGPFYEARALFADKIYPINDKKILAVTGTNGKTTTVEFVRQLLVNKNIGVLTIGTLGVYLNEKKQNDFSLTSPDYIDLRKALYHYRGGYEVCALEASSHAIEQKRLYGLGFASLGWTSFSQDHLDYHKTMDAYFEAKLKLAGKDKKFVTSPRASDLNKRLGDRAQQSEKVELQDPPDFLKGAFNKINLEVALGCLKEAGVQIEKEELNVLAPPPGRFNIIEIKGRTFVIDFAHTPDALLNIGAELKKSYPKRELVTVFGCGGDRDRAKRKLMGEAASDFSDAVVVTSDNPRTEGPQQIMNDVLEGVSAPYQAIVDRAEAIRYSFDKYKSAVILVAGKGHEPYIDINGEKRPYSDEETIRSLNDRV